MPTSPTRALTRAYSPGRRGSHGIVIFDPPAAGRADSRLQWHSSGINDVSEQAQVIHLLSMEHLRPIRFRNKGCHSQLAKVWQGPLPSKGFARSTQRSLRPARWIAHRSLGRLRRHWIWRNWIPKFESTVRWNRDCGRTSPTRSV